MDLKSNLTEDSVITPNVNDFDHLHGQGKLQEKSKSILPVQNEYPSKIESFVVCD